MLRKKERASSFFVARNFQTSAHVVILVVRIVPIELDLAIVRIPVAVRDVAVGEPVLLSYFVRITGNLFQNFLCYSRGKSEHSVK